MPCSKPLVASTLYKLSRHTSSEENRNKVWVPSICHFRQTASADLNMCRPASCRRLQKALSHQVQARLLGNSSTHALC